jgi:hypothetical protein
MKGLCRLRQQDQRRSWRYFIVVSGIVPKISARVQEVVNGCSALKICLHSHPYVCLLRVFNSSSTGGDFYLILAHREQFLGQIEQSVTE